MRMILRFLIAVFFIGCQLAGCEVARADGGGAPLGHWEGDFREVLRVCLDLQKGSHILLTFHDRKYRNPVVLEGSYAVRSAAGGPLELTMKVERIVTKEIGRCRRYWVRMDLEQYEGLGIKAKPGSQLRLRLTLSCADKVSRVRLCFVDEASGKDGACQKLSARSDRLCEPGPPQTLDQILPVEHDPTRPRGPIPDF